MQVNSFLLKCVFIAAISTGDILMAMEPPPPPVDFGACVAKDIPILIQVQSVKLGDEKMRVVESTVIDSAENRLIGKHFFLLFGRTPGDFDNKNETGLTATNDLLVQCQTGDKLVVFVSDLSTKPNGDFSSVLLRADYSGQAIFRFTLKEWMGYVDKKNDFSQRRPVWSVR